VEQLQRFAVELDSLSAPAPLAEILHLERYRSLHLTQGMAHGDVGPELLHMHPDVEEASGKVLAKLAVDWNVVMSEINQCFDQPGEEPG